MLTTLVVLALAQQPVPEDAFGVPTPPPIVELGDDEGAPPVEGEDEAGPVQPESTPVVASVDAFQGPLAAYGTWSTVRGVRAWLPSAAIVGHDFVPYASGGQWVSTRAGWVFESSHPFGWATYHYGRWWYEDGYGWVWIPDTVWGPAWVDWRFGGGYAGWAPLPPVWLTSWHRPRWFFVPTPWFCGHEVWRHRVAPGAYQTAWSVTAPLAPRRWGSVTWYSGPKWGQVARYVPQPPVRRPVTTYYPPHGAVPVSIARPLPTSPPRPMPHQPGHPHPSGGYQAPPPQLPRQPEPGPGYRPPPPQQTPRAYPMPPAPMPQQAPRAYPAPAAPMPQQPAPRSYPTPPPPMPQQVPRMAPVPSAPVPRQAPKSFDSAPKAPHTAGRHHR